MVDSGIPGGCWEIKLKKCETSPRPSEGRLCVRPGPMATQYIHTQQEARLVPGRSVILFILYMLCCHYGPLALAVKSFQVQQLFNP